MGEKKLSPADQMFAEQQKVLDQFEKDFEAFFVGNNYVSQEDYDRIIKDKD